MAEVTLSSKNQIVVPREVREALQVKAGDKLLIVIRGNTVIMTPKPKRHSSAIQGLVKNIYPDDYLQTERDSWD